MVPSPDRLLDFLSPWRDAPRWWIGLSGGLDSCVLLQLLAEARQAAARTSPLPTLTAVHVDHQLSAHSPGWSRHCEALCRSLEVELVIRRVVVAAGATGPEAAAREARYAVFEELVGPGDLLLLAHHLDDQVETLFLRLMRGAGTRGLAGMPRQRRLGKGELCRPLLAFTRESLEDFATERGLAWVEDESNCDLSPDRNYLRHRVLPRLEERWPAYRASVAASIDAVADAETALAALDQASLARARRCSTLERSTRPLPGLPGSCGAGCRLRDMHRRVATNWWNSRGNFAKQSRIPVSRSPAPATVSGATATRSTSAGIRPGCLRPSPSLSPRAR